MAGIGLIGGIDALEIGGRSPAFWGLGQVGVAIKGPTGVLYVDPYLTDSDGEGGSLPRTFPPLAPIEVTNASAVLLTHVHIDHTDPDTILPLSKASPESSPLLRAATHSSKRDSTKVASSCPRSGIRWRFRGSW